MSYYVVDSDISPREICFEAAKNISTLLRSYSQLYTLRRTPSFLPHLLASTILSLYIPPSVPSQPPRMQIELSLKNEVAEIMSQATLYLKAMGLCHRSAKRAHYLIGIIRKEEKIVASAHMALASGDRTLVAPAVSTDLASKLLDEELLRRRDEVGGRFVGISDGMRKDMPQLENPPFWLMHRPEWTVFPTRKIEKAAGFALLDGSKG